MSAVTSEVSPLNCHWISWKDTLPVCTRPHATPHVVSEAECGICEFWTDDEGLADAKGHVHGPAPHPRPQAPADRDPLNREACPRCGSHDVVVMQRDAVVQSFSCSICHQRWLATRPWPLLRETRSRRAD
jgi:hypothetical protein